MTTNAARTEQGTYTYQDPAAGIDARVGDLLGRMTLEEKVGQMMQLDARGGNLSELILDKHVGSILHTSPSDLPAAMEMACQRTRLGIPLIVGDDCIHGYSFWPGATIFPTQLGMANSWDPAKVEAAARATAQEVAATGLHWTFSPVLCIARDPRWGRVDETFGEDPTLIGELASAMVRGYQGGAKVGQSLAPDAILACAKHFAGYSETQGGRDASEADLSHRKLLSWFLPPFERVASEGCGSFMLGYEAIDGVPVTFNSWLLSDVLRGQWGYRGMLVTDWDNVGRSVWEQHIKADITQAAADAVKAGNDLIMTTPSFYEGALAAVQQGTLSESLIDQAVSRVLGVKFRLGLFENPRLPNKERIERVVGSQEHQELNLELARESAVLLTNDGSLPLLQSPAQEASQPARTIAVVGPLADDAQGQLGDWAGSSGQVSWMQDGQPRQMITTLLDGLRGQAPEGWQVTYARGADIVRLVPDPEGETFPDGQPRPKIAVPAQVDAGMIEQALAQARQADVVVAAVGDHIALVGEGRSTATLELQGGQQELLKALSQVCQAEGKPLIVVLMASKPQVLPQAALEASALIWAPNPGMKGGQALAEILFGSSEPCGRLPITFPRHAGQLPVYYNQIRGQHGNRYADLTQDPAFAFGEGLSYTSFAYGELEIEGAQTLRVGDTLHASIRLTNTGNRRGTEVVQAYVSDLVTSVTWAEHELKAFRRVTLEPGESRTVHIDLPVSACSLVDAEGNRRIEPGEFDLQVGHSSRSEDLTCARFQVLE
ncbi:glycosyl hydrolase [Bombiscardovia nodaiensis]|uniref:beta-glucosidase n=1 Tax=Bombiscardovia nodaiensis TaxID=2932181 RepID=A0ABN6SB96_9BIFI|nr:glycosyl hydrolase [Bombiscardovia nodaiensis]